MNTVTVEFAETTDTSSLKVGDNVLVNTIPGVVVYKINPPPPPPPPIIAEDYFCDSAHVTLGQITSGDHVTLHTKDGKNLTIMSSLAGGYYNVDWQAEFQLPVGMVSGLSLNYVGRYSQFRGHTTFIFDFVKSSWVMLEARTIGASVADISVVIKYPTNYISSSGQVRVRFSSSSTAGFTTYIDCLKLGVK
jgi:hypothetical protein